MHLFSRMRKLIKEGKREFKDRNDRNYLADLYNLSLTVDEAWREILSLNKNFYFSDPMPNYNQSPNSLTLRK